MEEQKLESREDIFSKVVRAGRRTYFFDVKATKNNDYYLTLTESKRNHIGESVQYEKHKIFLYKEDFIKFSEGLAEAIEYIKEKQGLPSDIEREERGDVADYKTDVEFDDLSFSAE